MGGGGGGGGRETDRQIDRDRNTEQEVTINTKACLNYIPWTQYIIVACENNQ